MRGLLDDMKSSVPDSTMEEVNSAGLEKESIEGENSAPSYSAEDSAAEEKIVSSSSWNSQAPPLEKNITEKAQMCTTSTQTLPWNSSSTLTVNSKPLTLTTVDVGTQTETSSAYSASSSNDTLDDNTLTISKSLPASTPSFPSTRTSDPIPTSPLSLSDFVNLVLQNLKILDPALAQEIQEKGLSAGDISLVQAFYKLANGRSCGV